MFSQNKYFLKQSFYKYISCVKFLRTQIIWPAILQLLMKQIQRTPRLWDTQTGNNLSTIQSVDRSVETASMSTPSEQWNIIIMLPYISQETRPRCAAPYCTGQTLYIVLSGIPSLLLSTVLTTCDPWDYEERWHSILYPSPFLNYLYNNINYNEIDNKYWVPNNKVLYQY